MLCKLAEQNSVRVTGNEHAGLFSGSGVEGDYQFVEGCLPAALPDGHRGGRTTRRALSSSSDGAFALKKAPT